MSMKLLIYEEDQEFAGQLTALFSDFGFKTLFASTDGEVQQAISDNVIDLFILRAEVAALSGYLLIKKLRKMKAYSDSPILLLSSKGDDKVFENHKNLAYSATEYLQLPAALEMILAVANDIFSFLPDDASDETSTEESGNVGELEEMISVLGTDNDELKSSVERLENRIKELNTDLEEATAKKPVEDENKKISSLEQKLGESQLFIEDLEKKVEDAKELTNNNESNDAQVKDLRVKWGDSQKAIEDLKQQLNKEIVAKENIANSLDTLEEEREGFEKKCETLKAQINEMEQTEDQGADEELVALRDKLQDAQDTNDDLHLINREMKDKVRRATTEVEQVKRDADKATEERDTAIEAQEKLEGARESEVEELEKKRVSEVEELTQQTESARVEMKEAHKKEMRALEDRVVSAASERDRVEIEFATAEQKLAEMTGAEVELKKSVEELGETVKNNAKELEELQEVKTSLDAKETEVTELTSQLEELDKKYKASKEKSASFGETIDRLNDKVELLDSMTVEVEAMKDKAAKLDDAVSQIEMYEEEQEKAQKEKATLEESVTKLQEESQGLEGKLSGQKDVLDTIAEALQRLEK